MTSLQGPAYTADSVLTSYQVGALLQVNPSSVNKWIKDGRMPAFRTPGGHRRIRAADVVSFLNAHKMPVPNSLQSASKKRLLIVTSESSEKQLWTQSLAPLSETVEAHFCDNSVEALIDLGRFMPQSVVLEGNTSSFDCLEVCRLLLASPNCKDMEVSITTQDASQEFSQKARRAGAKHCLVRPMTGEMLLTTLELIPRSMLAS